MEDEVDLYSIYSQKITDVINSSKQSLKEILLHKNLNDEDLTKCVIFDIDDTLITNNHIPIKEVIEFYKYVKYNLNISTIIITARKKTTEYQTKKLLDKIGIFDYDFLFMRDNFYIKNISYFKFDMRKILSERYEIIANVGNYYSDFFGGYNGLIIKIPTILECIDQLI
jgi:hypothetical protein